MTIEVRPLREDSDVAGGRKGPSAIGSMKGTEVEEPWNIIEQPPLVNYKKSLSPIEGTWHLISSKGFDQYLAAVGVTPLVAAMVMRSDAMVTIYEGLPRLMSINIDAEIKEKFQLIKYDQIFYTVCKIHRDIDRLWKILTETSIKGKSIRGYRTKNYKMTANKFKLGEPKPEVLEDWDPRLVVSTVLMDEDDRMTIDQVAEKDQRFCKDSSVTWEAQGDILTMTCETVDGVRAVRHFARHRPQEKMTPNRKLSAPF